MKHNGICKYLIYTLIAVLILFQRNLAADERENLGEDTGWEFAAFFGVFTTQSPLSGTKPPLPLSPYFEIAYYGDKFFFDKATVGYSLYERYDFSLAAVASPLQDSFYFIPPDIDDKSTLESRKISAGGGLEIAVSKPWGDILWQGLHDISFAHQGYLSELVYTPPGWDEGVWRLDARFGASYRSQKLLNYYYGVRSSEVTSERDTYSAKSGINWFVEVEYNHQINKFWQFKTFLTYKKLSNEISNSPLVDKSELITVFIGIGHEW